MKIMAVDFGDARTGLACCDRTEYLASPIGVIHDKDFGSVVQKVASSASEYGAEMVIVGHPINMDGSEGPAPSSAPTSPTSSPGWSTSPVRLWDERGTTVSATGYLNATNTRGKKRKEVIDEVAATIILESYMNYRRNHPDED